MTRLQVRGVTRSFGKTVALSGIDFDAQAGQVLAVLGENGAGKSTVMKILAGAEAPDAGTIALDGAPFAPASPAAARRAGVVLVSQELSLCPHLSVAENVVLGEEPTRGGRIDRTRMATMVADALAQVGASGRIDPGARADTLSIGAMQLVEIARALVHGERTRVLILDEPTSSLDREDAGNLFRLVRSLAERGLTILYVSHFLEEVMQIADRFTVLRDGATVASGAIADTTTDALVESMAGRKVDTLFPRSARTRGDVVLSLSDLAAPGVRRASLALHRGEVLGLAGLVGAGRTELLRAIFGLAPVTAGTIRVARVDGPADPRHRLRQGVGMLSEDRKGEGLATTMSIADNVVLSRMEPLSPGTGWAGRLASLLGLVSPSRKDEVTRALATELGLKYEVPSQRVADLSGGNQQKVALARLLHHDVDVILLDEPTRGIDVASKAQIYALVDRLAARGKAVLMVSSYMPELLGVCDRVAVMCRGELSPARETEAWTEASLLAVASGAAA